MLSQSLVFYAHSFHIENCRSIIGLDGKPVSINTIHMSAMKKIVSFLIRFFLVIILIIAVAFAGLIAYYFITKKSASDFLPGAFTAYVKVSSIKDLYDKALDLKAADIVFAEIPELAPIHKAITGFKSEGIARSFYFKKLLDVEMNACIDDDQSPLLIFDPGLLSLPIRLFPIVNVFVKIEGLDIDIIQKGKIAIYVVKVGPKDKIYFSINDNLILVSTREEPIEASYLLNKEGTTLSKNKDAMALAGRVQKNKLVYTIVNTSALVKSMTSGNETLKSIVKEFSFNGYSALAFDISNTELSIEALTSVTSTNPAISSFMTYSPPGQRSLTMLPDSMSVYSSVSPGSFKDLVRIVSSIKERDPEKLTKQIDDACRFLFNKSADDLLYSWIGSEAGVVTLAGSGAPIAYIKIKDRARLDEALQTISGSALLDEDSSLVLDGVRLTKIVLPDFIKALASLFVKGIDTPYYLIMGDVIYFCMEAKNLSLINVSYRSNKTIVKDEAFKLITREIPLNAHVSLYYNMETGVPDFLPPNNLVTKLLASYKQGIISVFLRNGEVKIEVASAGSTGAGIAACPGFPKVLPGGIASDVLVSDMKGSRLPELVYVSKDKKLVIYDPTDGSSLSTEAEEDSSIIAARSARTGKDEVTLFESSGILARFDGEAKPIAPFPITTSARGSFPPIEEKGDIVLFSQDEKALIFISQDGTISRLGFKFEQPLLSPPAFGSGIIAFYPKSFSGTVYCTDRSGEILPGWPEDGKGISLASPLVFETGGSGEAVAFLTQAGILSMWKANGEALSGFPIELEGTFAANTESIQARIASGYRGSEPNGVVCLNTDGVLYVIDMSGLVLARKKVEGVGGKNARFVLYDYNRDGIDEIFIYGSSNYITALGRGLALIPGFPVKGSKKCAFADINADGKKELITGSFDGNVYAYLLGG
jgi:hypothetical protein